MIFSVLMSVYARENPECLRQSLQSLADQTMLADEVVMVEDGPIGAELSEVIENFRTALNIKSIRLESNSGLAVALNKGLKHCVNDLVARMDTDDISLPERFEKQVAFMRQYPYIAVSSTWIEEIDKEGQVFSIRKLPARHDELEIFARKRCPISHPAAIFRKQAVLAVGGYPLLRKSQDYGLWVKLLVHGYRLANIQEPLYRMRVQTMFGAGRGLEQLKNELAMFRFQKQIGFIGWYALVRNVSIRFILRLSPVFVKKFLYKFGRSV